MPTTNQHSPVRLAVTRMHDDLALLARAEEIAPQYGFKLILADKTEVPTEEASDPEVGAEQAVNPNAPRRTGLTAVVRDTYRAYTKPFSIRTIADDLKQSNPELARGENLMVNISAVLVRAKEKQEIVLLTQGTAGEPSVYRNAATPQTSNGTEPVRDQEEI